MARGQDTGAIEVVRREVTSEGDVILDLTFDSQINLFPLRKEVDERLKELSRYPKTAALVKNWKRSLPDGELSGLEGFNALYTLLDLEVEGGFRPQEIEVMRQELRVAGDFSDEKVLALHRLQNVLPLLDVPSPSTDSFREMLLENSGGDILAAAAEEDDWEAIRHAARIIEMLLVSREDWRVPAYEEAVADNFAWAQDRSQIFNRRVKHMPLVVSPDTLWMMGFHDEVTIIPKILKVKTFLNGFAYSALPGNGGIEPTVIVAHTGESKEGAYLDEEVLRKTMVHEMIHDTQEYNTLAKEEDLPQGWSQVESVQFLEGLTDGLAILRMKEEGRAEAVLTQGSYQLYVSSLFSLLEDAGIEQEGFADYLTYLNNIPLPEAIALLEEKTGQEDLKKAFQDNFRPDLPRIKKSRAIFRPIKTFKEITALLEEHQRRSVSLVQEVFAAAPLFQKRAG